MPGMQKNQSIKVLIVSIGILSLVIRLWGLTSRGLWYDELQSVTYSILPLNELVRSVQTYDPHPPFYYLQLHWWMLFGVSDLWIKLNSVLWSILTTILLFIVGKKIFNVEVAVIASILFSISPYSVVQSQNARMYSLLMFFGLLSFFFTHQFLCNTRALLSGIGIIISTEIFLYSYGAGFVLLVSLLSYVVARILNSNIEERKRFVQWCFMQLVVLVLYLPWLKHAYSINLGHLLVPNLTTVVNTLYVLLFGFSVKGNPEWLRWSLLLFPVIAMGIAAAKERGRWILVSFTIVPIVFCVAVSYLYRPIWLHRTLAYTLPFLNLAVALAISEWQAGRGGVTLLLGNIFSLTIILSFLVALVYQQFTFRYPWNIEEAVEYVKSEIQAGDVIYVPHERVFWGWLWYFIGPGSVNPMNTDYSIVAPRGVRILAKPAIDRYWIERGKNYWLVHRNIDSVSPFESYLPDTTRDFNQLYVECLRSSLAH